ncbi:MAG TPA: ABC transporter ATP-binding protein [Gaiellales bacterium]|jgi:peptide/nickel transport system ATP-binding protein/oligopeptide transport system ATP-binding protein
MSDAPILDVRDLRVELPLSRGTVHAVDGASISVAPGEAFGLVGESGCGKSMTLRAIMGLLPRPGHVTGGEVLFEGEDLVTASAGRLRQIRGGSIAMIFQEPMTALNPVMRVGDQIAEAPRVHLGLSGTAARQRALDLMRRVGIPDPVRRARAYPHELSGGLRQRIMIAIALSCDPKLILCDEPTTALDVTIQDQILKLLLNLRREFGVSVVFVTHDLAVVAETCERLAVMYAGQIVETGTVDEVFRAPRHPYTLGLLRSVPDFDSVQDSLSAIQGAPPDLVIPPPGCRFHPRCPFAQQDCLSGEFPLRPLSAGRATACIHPDAPAADVARMPVVADA